MFASRFRSSGCGETFEAAVEIVFQIVEVFEADRKTQRRSARRPSRGGAIACAIEGNDEAFIAAPGIAEAEQFETVEHRGDRGFAHRVQDDAEEAGRTGEIALPQRMAGVARQRGMDDARNLRPPLEPAGE